MFWSEDLYQAVHFGYVSLTVDKTVMWSIDARYYVILHHRQSSFADVVSIPSLVIIVWEFQGSTFSAFLSRPIDS